MKKYLIVLVVAGIALSSCYKKLELKPANAITNEQMEELLLNATDAQWSGVVGSFPTVIITNTGGSGSLEFRYNRLTGANIMRGLESNDMIFASQNLVSGVSTAFGSEEYQMVSYRTEGGIAAETYWKLGWDMITKANKALAVVTDRVVETNDALLKYQAWPLFIRAYAYNYLVENYADAHAIKGGSALGVPIYLEFNPGPENYQARATLDQCYAQINADLTKAINNFTNNGASTGFEAASSALDVGAAYFLKARVALCTGKWADAISACDKILAEFGTTLMSETQYVAQRDEDNGQAIYYAVKSGFLNLDQNPEVVYGFDYGAAGVDNQLITQWLNPYGCTNLAGSKEGRMTQIDERLYNLMDDDDYRKQNFLAPGNPDLTVYTYADGNTKTILPYTSIKHAATVGMTAGSGGLDLSDAANNSLHASYPMWRLSEVLLMKAEAEARGGAGDWKSTLNTLVDARTNGALTVDTYPAHAGLTPLQIIQLQYRMEMWGENGLEWYNNRRWDIPVDRTSSTNHWSPTKTYPVSGMTSQLPTAQLNLNGLLTQNP